MTKTTESTTVGRPYTIENIVLPGTKLEPKADPDRTAPVSIRIVDAAPHGTSLRYTLEATGWEPGAHDLREFLVRADGTATTDLPPIPFAVQSVLMVGIPRVSTPEPVPVTGLAGYRQQAILAAALWLAGLLALAWLLRRRRGQTEAATTDAATTPAEQLSRLIAKARGGTLAPADDAAIERLVYDAWRRSLHLDDANPRSLVAALRRDEAAGRAISRMEAWLHAPRGSDAQPSEALDVAALVEGLLPKEPRR
ncbi:MAG: hypothetical protein NTW36_09920 [Planctomycetia bacterium]|jgi:hypothetical protein|nr:hypothetical protein [Planctomycetia bacterium]